MHIQNDLSLRRGEGGDLLGDALAKGGRVGCVGGLGEEGGFGEDAGSFLDERCCYETFAFEGTDWSVNIGGWDGFSIAMLCFLVGVSGCEGEVGRGREL